MRDLLRGSALKRVALMTALGAVAVAAVLGIIALLGGGFGDTEGKVHTTSLLVTAAAFIALRRYKVGIITVIGACAVAGLAWSLLT